MLNRRHAIGALIAAPVLGLSLPRSARAGEPMVFQASPPVAINGFDPVAYFTDAAPIAGNAAFSVSWNGAEWHFATARNQDAFANDPEGYAPVFGGYCAFAASRGYLAPTIPEAWAVYEDRLYLNATLRARQLWLAELPDVIEAGHANWPGILG